MRDKKNYCVDGKCTAYTGDQNCIYYKYDECGVCVYYDFSSDDDECKSEEANAEWMQTNGTDN